MSMFLFYDPLSKSDILTYKKAYAVINNFLINLSSFFRMESYTEWNNNKIYQGHVRRLTQIKEKQQKIIKTHRNFRIKSEPSKSQPNVKKQFLPVPLVSKQQRSLLGEVVKEKTMNLRQKESLLENYLLSRRILETNSVFDSKLLKKEFNFHKKVSQNMNRSLQQNRKTFSELRNKKFEELQKLREQNYLGTGRVYFDMRIHQIMIIKRVLEENNKSRFNLIYKPEKFKSYTVKALTFTELITKKHYFRASRKQIHKLNGLKFQIEEVRGIDCFKMGEFRLRFSVRDAQKQESENDFFEGTNPKQKKETVQQGEKKSKKCIQQLLHSVTKCLIGTIELTVQSKELINE